MVLRNTSIGVFTVLSAAYALAGCGGGGSDSGALSCYNSSESVNGCIQTVDHISNLSIVASDAGTLRAEYLAGFIQSRLQKDAVVQARDNTWDNAYLTDPSHSFPKQLPPSSAELEAARRTLLRNYDYTVNFIVRQGGAALGFNLKRLLFRMLGIYHGTALAEPADLDFSGAWLPTASYFREEELALNYEAPGMSFMDVYFINAAEDLFSVPIETGAARGAYPERCSAFLKKFGGDVALAHNAWAGFLDQSLAVNLYVNGLYQSYNALMPGFVSSETDFGYTNNGLMFTGTAFHPGRPVVGKVDALWMVWKAALAEQFASSPDEFFYYISQDLSGTGLGGYLIVDLKTRAIASIEISDRSVVYFRPKGSGAYQVITKPAGLSTGYDAELLQPDYILGINYPISYQIRADLQAVDTRPARRRQFLARIGGVHDVESAKDLITYTDPANPLSIYGRWDLGWGETPAPKTVPDGSIDAKVALASMTGYAFDMQGRLERQAGQPSIWMKFGTPVIDGEPFIWSKSIWRGQVLRGVPNRVAGEFQLLESFIK